MCDNTRLIKNVHNQASDYTSYYSSYFQTACLIIRMIAHIIAHIIAPLFYLWLLQFISNNGSRGRLIA